jgi:hypothetical protein
MRSKRLGLTSRASIEREQSRHTTRSRQDPARVTAPGRLRQGQGAKGQRGPGQGLAPREGARVLLGGEGRLPRRMQEGRQATPPPAAEAPA